MGQLAMDLEFYCWLALCEADRDNRRIQLSSQLSKPQYCCCGWGTSCLDVQVRLVNITRTPGNLKVYPT